MYSTEITTGRKNTYSEQFSIGYVAVTVHVIDAGSSEVKREYPPDMSVLSSCVVMAD
jgi:hypothetical protein